MLQLFYIGLEGNVGLSPKITPVEQSLCEGISIFGFISFILTTVGIVGQVPTLYLNSFHKRPTLVNSAKDLAGLTQNCSCVRSLKCETE